MEFYKDCKSCAHSDPAHSDYCLECDYTGCFAPKNKSQFDLMPDEFSEYAWLQHCADLCIRAGSRASEKFAPIWYGKAQALRRMAFEMTLEQAEKPAITSHA